MQDTIGRVTHGWFECPNCSCQVEINRGNLRGVQCPQCRKSWEYGLWLRVPVPGRHYRVPLVEVREAGATRNRK